MNVVLTYFIYLLISIGLTVGVGWALARSGRTFLLEVFDGNGGLADALNPRPAVGFSPLNSGFGTPTMRTSWTLATARRGCALPSVQVARGVVVSADRTA